MAEDHLKWNLLSPISGQYARGLCQPLASPILHHRRRQLTVGLLSNSRCNSPPAPLSCTLDRQVTAMPAVEDPRHRIAVHALSVYIQEQSHPETDRYAFAYTITIQNTGSIAARLLDRHWIITDANGQVQEVRGEGVVGEQPHLRPGESFRYTSGTILPTPVGSMHGSYGMIADDGTRFSARIEPFTLAVPRRLH